MKKQENPYSELVIKEYTHWRLELYTNQCYLGRCVLYYKGNKSDLLETTSEEYMEMHTILKDLQRVIRELFQPDKFNYSIMGNSDPKLHVHFFPRYKTERVFAGYKFNDYGWGNMPYPYDNAFTLPQNILLEIKEAIKNKLK